jgi:hypothetical protein
MMDGILIIATDHFVIGNAPEAIAIDGCYSMEVSLFGRYSDNSGQLVANNNVICVYYLVCRAILILTSVLNGFSSSPSKESTLMRSRHMVSQAMISLLTSS